MAPTRKQLEAWRRAWSLVFEVARSGRIAPGGGYEVDEAILSLAAAATLLVPLAERLVKHTAPLLRNVAKDLHALGHPGLARDLEEEATEFAPPGVVLGGPENGQPSASRK